MCNNCRLRKKGQVVALSCNFLSHTLDMPIGTVLRGAFYHAVMFSTAAPGNQSNINLLEGYTVCHGMCFNSIQLICVKWVTAEMQNVHGSIQFTTS